MHDFHKWLGLQYNDEKLDKKKKKRYKSAIDFGS